MKYLLFLLLSLFASIGNSQVNFPNIDSLQSYLADGSWDLFLASSGWTGTDTFPNENFAYKFVFNKMSNDTSIMELEVFENNVLVSESEIILSRKENSICCYELSGMPQVIQGFYIYPFYNINQSEQLPDTMIISPLTSATVLFFARSKSNSLANENIPVLNKQLFVFPNPSSTYINVIIPENYSSGLFKIFDMEGKLVHKEPYFGSVQFQSLLLSNLNNGKYIIHFIPSTSKGKTIYTSKLIISK